MEEEALLLGPHRSLVGIFTYAQPGSPQHRADTTVMLLNAGLIHHAGPHRLHVKLARALAARGVNALRFDSSGIGDSSVRPDGLPARELAVREPREIMDELAKRGQRNFVLFGICSGARQALMAVAGDRRVKGLALINPGTMIGDSPEPDSRATTQYYLRYSLWNPRAWLNLLTGRVNYRRLLQTFGGTLRRAGRGVDRGNAKPALTEMIRRELTPVLAQGTSMLVVLSDRDAQFAKLLDGGIQSLQTNGQPQFELYPEADHLFTSLMHQDLLVEQVCRWVQSRQGGASETGETPPLRALSVD